MNRLSKITAFLAALILLAAMTGLVGCQHSGNAVAPSQNQTASSIPPPSPDGQGVVMGYFQFVFNPDGTVKVEDATPIRGAQVDVTKWASVIIENFFFNEGERNWYVTASVKNISSFTGYDVLTVFHSLGEKFVINQDGFLWANPPIFPQPTRCAFLAYGKAQKDRMYPPMFEDSRTIVIHQPEGVPKLAPLGFWVEAFAKPRPFPGVEDLKVDAVDKTDFHLTGNIWDHQSPSGDLTVWADCTSFNGQSNVPMYDDGQHGDGAAGDNIFGCDFSGAPADGVYTITVYAVDPQKNKGENDVMFPFGSSAPCDKPYEHFQFGTIAQGELSGIHDKTEMVINDPDTWTKIWAAHTSNLSPAPPLPPVDFNKNTIVGVWLGERPSNNHMVNITDIYYDPCENLLSILYDYSPNIACGPLDVLDYPYDIVVMPKSTWPFYFVGTEVKCPPPPPDCVEPIKFADVVHGILSGIHDPYEKVITNTGDFAALWKQHTSNMYPPPPAPTIDFTANNVIAVALGDRPTGGFECNIQKICNLSDSTIGVFYAERIPGPDCIENHIIYQPFHWVTIPKSDAPVQFFKHPEVYDCGSSDCNQPQVFFPIDQGPKSAHKAGEFVIKDQDSWNAFWKEHEGLNDNPPPAVDFTQQMVLAMMLGDRPTTNYSVETKDVRLNPSDDGTIHMDVNYFEHTPGKNCAVGNIVTDPYQIIVAPLFDGTVIFHKTVDVIDCPPPVDCVDRPYYQLAADVQSCQDSGQFFFPTQDGAMSFWNAVYCNLNVPPLPGYPSPIQGGTMIGIGIQIDQQATTGFYLTIDGFCMRGTEAHVKYSIHIPGSTCQVDPVTTKPWVFGVVEVPNLDSQITWVFEPNKVVYDCGDPCNPMPFYNLANGDQSCAPVGEFGWLDDTGYKEFWGNVWCNGELPPLPTDPSPVQGGILYHFGIQIEPQQTTGYYITIDKVCVQDCDVFIDYTENIPGDNCNVGQTVTQPWMVGAAELPPVYCAWNWHFIRHDQVYQCK